MSLANMLKVGLEQLKASKTARLFGIPAAIGVGVGTGAYVAGVGVSKGLEEMGQKTEQKVSGLAIAIILLLIGTYAVIKVIEAWKKR